ncbi:hypothetical protein Tco_0067983 [Tanacetum coccineum]
MGDGENPAKEKGVLSSNDDAYDFSEEVEKKLADLGYSTQSRDADLAIRAQRFKAPSVVPRNADNDAYDFSEEVEKDLADLGHHKVVPRDADNADDAYDFSEELEKDLGDLGYSTQSMDADLAIIYADEVGDDSDDADDFLEHMRKQEGYDLGIRTQEFFRSDADEFIEHMEKQVGDDSDDFIEHMRKQVGDDLGIKTRSFFQQSQTFLWMWMGLR